MNYRKPLDDLNESEDDLGVDSDYIPPNMKPTNMIQTSQTSQENPLLEIKYSLSSLNIFSRQFIFEDNKTNKTNNHFSKKLCTVKIRQYLRLSNPS